MESLILKSINHVKLVSKKNINVGNIFHLRDLVPLI